MVRSHPSRIHRPTSPPPNVGHAPTQTTPTVTMKTKAPSLRLLLTNAFSIYNKMDELQHTLESLHVDIAVVTETKLSPDKATVAEVSIPGNYPPIRRDRTAQGSGVAIWLKEGMAYKQLDINSECKTLWISVAAPSGMKFVICAAYRPGTSADSDCSIFIQLESDIDKVRQSCSHYCGRGLQCPQSRRAWKSTHLGCWRSCRRHVLCTWSPTTRHLSHSWRKHP